MVIVAGENWAALPGPTVIVGTVGEVALNVRGEPLAPDTEATAVCAPPPAPSVHVATATPFASVVLVAGASEPPLGVAQVTVAPS